MNKRKKLNIELTMFNFFCRKSRNVMYRNLIYSVIPYNSIRNDVTNSNNIVIDVRDENEYNAMHILNSVNIPVRKILSNEMMYKGKSKIIVYCSTGDRTKEAIKSLNSIGYTNIYVWKYGTISSFPHRDLIIIG